MDNLWLLPYSHFRVVSSNRVGGEGFDIGIVAAYITAEATAQGLGSCIVGLFDDMAVREICDLDAPVRLLITLGYERQDVVRREKRRKDAEMLIRRK